MRYIFPLLLFPFFLTAQIDSTSLEFTIGNIDTLISYSKDIHIGYFLKPTIDTVEVRVLCDEKGVPVFRSVRQEIETVDGYWVKSRQYIDSISNCYYLIEINDQ